LAAALTEGAPPDGAERLAAALTEGGPPGEPAVARHALALAGAEVAAGDRRALDRLAEVLRAASPTWTWDDHDPVATARFVALGRDLAVVDRPDGPAMCPLLPDGWRGRPVEVEGAPTAAGRLSYAVRWHGDRPALLWDLAPSAGPARLTAPGLDPAWSTTEPSGEALLG
ncbi:MAG TPA: hypothetical protein VGB14_01950, partial [Acidimicrobiales bacterium]